MHCWFTDAIRSYLICDIVDNDNTISSSIIA